MLSKNKTKKIAVVLIIALVFGAMAMQPSFVTNAFACCFPCPVVFDTQIPMKVYQWYQNYTKPYVDRLKADYEAKMKQRMIPGVYGQLSSRVMGIFDTHNILGVSSTASVTSTRVLTQFAPLTNNAHESDINALTRSNIGRHYASNAFTIGEDAYKQTLETDEALQTVSPSKIDFQASSGIKKDAPKMAMIQGGILATTLRVMVAREAYNATR